jgi:prolyl-tRNA editing enzyme YbaK/EbsC (Cys-tRNA(Pro) deacylase)
MFVNGGRRGLLVGVSPECLVRTLQAAPVDVALDA